MSAKDRLSCFKAYDIRGRIPDELDRDLVVAIARAYASWLRPKKVAVGYDVRLTSPDFAAAICEGLCASGVDVIDIGRCGTEQVYFATFHLGLDGGIMVTASHNPADYNGLKLVRERAKPISADTGLREIETLTLARTFETARRRGTVEQADLQGEYVRHLLSYVDVPSLRPLTVVSNPGNGGAGPIVEALAPHLPFRFVRVHHDPDGRFPNGIPNPLLPEKRADTAKALTASQADAGIAWDGDFDRCFLFDERGGFIEGYYIVGLLASQILKRAKGAKIVHDPRLTWNTIQVVREAGGIPVQSKSGHAFMKEVMRREDAAYGGEMSAHHFFRDFAYCDSGMIPWLLVLEIMSHTGRSLSDLVAEHVRRFPTSGEINRKVGDARAVLSTIRQTYGPHALAVDETDGVGMEFHAWRFNLRMSNTEPLIRLNVESRGDPELLRAKTDELLGVIGGTPQD
ncbi:MAG TPA: phosphomannomutase CpsG [Candidatus Polarisedimenticolaceae bacterium]|nr:phosphomannomutase CpsG [Candidatus Polarisedimenticolaceae bacterium]